MYTYCKALLPLGRLLDEENYQEPSNETSHGGYVRER